MYFHQVFKSKYKNNMKYFCIKNSVVLFNKATALIVKIWVFTNIIVADSGCRGRGAQLAAAAAAGSPHIPRSTAAP